jgi:hypothetical protein
MDDALKTLTAMQPREPTDEEYDGLDGLDRQAFFFAGYRTALEEMRAALTAKMEKR